MAQPAKDLGKLTAVYGIAPAHLQRAVVVVLLSFLFFLGMMFAYYSRRSALYFLGATGFLIVYLITMFSWIVQRRSVVKVFQNGIEYKKFSARWEDVSRAELVGKPGRQQIELAGPKRSRSVIPSSIDNLMELHHLISARTAERPSL